MNSHVIERQIVAENAYEPSNHHETKIVAENEDIVEADFQSNENDDSQEADFTSSSLEDAPKKSYASIVSIFINLPLAVQALFLFKALKLIISLFAG